MSNSIAQFMHNNTVLAPMAGYTDSGYRSICASYGCGMTVTEMVSAKALVMGNVNTQSLLVRQDNDTSCALQIFGHEPDVMADSINLPCTSNFAVVDINMGCPVRKIVGNGDGSALLENVPLASNIISTVKKACGNDRLLTVKVRTGVDNSSGVVDFVNMCQDSGADMVTVHLRTRQQMYMGQADYSILSQICESVSIPVIANGDVDSIDKYNYLTQQCGAYGVAIGRGALGRPYIFSQLLGRQYQFDMISTVRQHIDMLLADKPEHVVVSEMKKHIAYYLRGIPYSKDTLIAVNNTSNTTDMLQALHTLGEAR